MSFIGPIYPGNNASEQELRLYWEAMAHVQHLRPGFLPAGTQVLLRDGRRGTVTNFTPYDGWNLGIRTDDDPNSGIITLVSSLTLL